MLGPSRDCNLAAKIAYRWVGCKFVIDIQCLGYGSVRFRRFLDQAHALLRIHTNTKRTDSNPPP